MEIAVLSGRIFAVETGSWRDINFTPDDRPDPLAHAFLIEINDAVHDAVIRDRSAVHPQFFYPADIIPDLVGTVQQTVFGMCMKVSKSQGLSPFCCEK